MEYLFKPSALRSLKKFPKQIQKRLIAKIDFYANSDNPLKYAETLKDKTLGEFRFRIGDYRIIFDVDNKNRSLIILLIGHRKDIYRK